MRILDRSAKTSRDIPERPVQAELVEYPGSLIRRLASPVSGGIVTEPAFGETNSSLDIKDGTGGMSMALAPGVDFLLGGKEQNVSTRTVGIVPPSGWRVGEMHKQIRASRLAKCDIELQRLRLPAV